MFLKTATASLLLAAIVAIVAFSIRPLPAAAAADDEGRLQAAFPPASPMLHARWLVRDGAPRDVQGIAQTPDGWLWLGSTDGLYRFDGVAFTRYRPPPGVTMSTNLSNIGTLPDGTLWTVPFFGGLVLIKGGQVRIFDEKDGLPGGTINKLAGGRDGRLWAAADSGLFLLEPGAGRWRTVTGALGLPGGVGDVIVDRQGTVWVQTAEGDPIGNHAMRSGESRFRLVATQAATGSIKEGPDGVIWATDSSRPGLRRLSPGVTPPALDALLGRMPITGGVHIDDRGGFWFAATRGVVRVALDGERGEAQEFTTRQGLSGEQAIAAFTDREGNVWISTEGGLDQFRPSRMRRLAPPTLMQDARALAASPAGELWTDTAYYRDIDAAPRPYREPGTRRDTVLQMVRDRHGAIVYCTYSRLWRLEGLTPVRIPLPPDVEARQMQPIYAIARDAGDALWISLGRRGPWRNEDGAWRAHGGIPALEGLASTNIAAGPDGRLWFGSVGSRIAVLREGEVRLFGPADGLDIGAVLTIVPDAEGAWLGGDEGLARFDGRRARRLQGSDGEQFQGGSGVVQDHDGALWINGPRGLAGIPAAEVRQFLRDPRYRVQYRRFDENDGLTGTVHMMFPIPSMVPLPGGRLAVSTTGGVFVFDPSQAQRNRLPPPVHVTGIVADGTEYAAAQASVGLAPAPDNVRIDYTALSLSLPRRVRFRYMLEGVDRGWQDAGNRRSAFYTGLAPGSYTFWVTAANDDGVWNEDGARLALTIPPTMFQTAWFRLACALLLALAVYGLHRLRLALALRTQRRSFEARVAERERIARDLHDTLLQSVQGLIMHFRRIALRTPQDAPTRPLMEKALVLATEVLEEGRDKVGDLRHAPQDADLAVLLASHGQRLAAQHAVAFALREEGVPRPLRPEALDEILAIGREAVGNAFLHARASRIEALLQHGDHELVLTVSDDGLGIDPSLRKGRAGHWGIPGMRERAAALGAALELDAAPGKGSAWRLRLPARAAYAGRGADPALSD